MSAFTDGSHDWHGFRIGQQPTLRFSVEYLEPLGKADEGWHLFRAEAVAPGFKALFDFQSQLGEFEVFRNQLLAMRETLQGEAHFESTESHIVVDGKMGHSGHVLWALALRSPRTGEILPELTFRVQEDQTMLWNVAAKIGDMLEWLRCEVR